MTQVHGGHLVARSLKKEGVEVIFSLSGIDLDYIYEACTDEGIRIIDVRQEQAAAAMADGWTRVTGKPGVVVVTPPGFISMIAGIKRAESSPVIALAGKSPFSQLDRGLLQEMDQSGFMAPITKWSRSIYETRRIPEYISMAFRHALIGQPGPVFLDIPYDIMYKKIDQAEVWYPEDYRTEAKPYGDPRDIQKAVELLINAEKPLIVGGNGLWWSHAGEELLELMEIVKLPFSIGHRKAKGRGVVPEDHPLFVGPLRKSLKQADVILALGIGSDRPTSPSEATMLGNEKTKNIQVDIDGNTIGLNMPVKVGIIGDVKSVLKQMVEEARDRCKGRKELPWVEECKADYKKWRQALDTQAASNAVPIHPARIWKEASDFIDRDAIVTVEGGEIGSWARPSFTVRYPGHLLDDGPNGCLGSAIPFGIAAKLAKPDKQVLVCVGDGAFGIGGMEFDTAVRHNIPIVALIANNGCWGRCRSRQLQTTGKQIGVNLGFTRYDKMVEGLGGYGEWVEKPDDIRPALQRAFASGKPACVNVKVDPDVKLPGGEG